MTASLAAGAVAAAVLFELVLVQTEGSPTTVATNLAYPLGDCAPALGRRGRRRAQRVAAERPLVAHRRGDPVHGGRGLLLSLPERRGTYVEGTWIDVLWVASLAPDRERELGRSGAGEIEVDGKPLLAVPTVCALLAIGVLVYDHFAQLSVLAVALAAATLLAVIARLALTFRDNRRLYELTRAEATTDALTELGNRRKLLSDLKRMLAGPAPAPTLLMIFDLDGFKGYNDNFGHPAGDALLARLGGKLAAVPGPVGAAYRLGGDEFCLVVPVAEDETERVIQRACEALQEHGEGFDVGSSFGAVLLPEEADSPSWALHLADERLYAQKRSRRSSGTMGTLLEALSLREPDRPEHLDSISELALDTGRRLGLDARRSPSSPAPHSSTTSGSSRCRTRSCASPACSTSASGSSSASTRSSASGSSARRPTCTASPRSSARRTSAGTATGYPDGLAGEDIPLASRILAACDTFTAITSPRAYRPQLGEAEALEELERHAGTQLDPAVVVALAEVLRARARATVR